jgi:DNA-directed RNA polymerase subunit E'/Rpb7
MTTLEYPAIFEERIPLTPKDLNRLSDVTVEDILIEKLRTKIEGRCSKHGYVIPGTLEVLSRSMGHVETGRFTGDVVYQVQSQGGVINPSDGTILQGEIIKKNKMGLYVEYKDAIRVLLPRDLHIANEEFESLQIGTKIEVEIKKSRFQVNDPYILCVGLYKKIVSDGAPAPAQPTIEEADEELDEDAEELQEASSPGFVEGDIA